MTNETKNLKTLMTLRINNSRYNLLVQAYSKKLNTTSNFLSKEEFIKEEIERVGTMFVQPIMITAPNKIAEMNYSMYKKHAYEWLKQGEDWPLQNIIANAKQNYLTQTNGAYFNEPEFNKAIVDNLSEGVAFIMYESFLKAELKKTPVPRTTKKKRTSIPKQAQVKALLQKEINNRCPFCKSGDVEQFEIHHIDDNPSNNNKANLILVCPTCHSRITKGNISMTEVIQMKSLLTSGIGGHNEVLDDSFLKLFKIHKSLVHDLNSTRLATIKRTANQLALNCKLQYDEGVNFFELLYRVLHLKYKCLDNKRDFKNVSKLFYDYDWMIKHYVRSFLSLLEFIYKKHLLGFNVNTYIDVMNTSSMDEIRLMYYYIVSRDNMERDKLIHMTKALNFFDVIKSPSLPLIYDEDWGEYE
jgi:hypothetical protein